MNINLVEIDEDIYKGKKVLFICSVIIPVVVIFRTFVPDRDFGTHPTLFSGVILVYNSWDILRQMKRIQIFPGTCTIWWTVGTEECNHRVELWR